MSFINAIGTAVPENCFPQIQIAEFMASALQMNEYDQRRLKALYRSTKINQRYSVLTDYGKTIDEYEFYPNTLDLEPFPSISQRMVAYKKYALPLCLKAIDNLGTLPDITHIITVSCTGMYAPGLDIEIIASLQLNTTIQRTAINFMGCYGAFNGLKMADVICKANPTAKVLVICVELCTLHFQKKMDEDFLLSNALFADGAAAVLITGTPSATGQSLALKSFFCDLYLEGKQDMAWQVADFGFEMTLTSYIPKLVKSGIKALTDKLLENCGLITQDISLYAMHPGGKAILEAIETALSISVEDNRYAYQILRDYGNMSSTTVLFVLKAIIEDVANVRKNQHILSCAFGPGLTLESMILEIV
ncbi:MULTISPECIES: type III polyketide synthase [unclassified Arcicella]|uniref:type III polyketide synthase n=1 Tax=unclassified Arcicella TaxID=2644986 RepID=UPI0028674CD9|nr:MULTISPECIES: type III polyketide synthase [unclassified Arcicella]MDR6564879.1 putative naringenin-chalcone synthase [Arcicella sp. BE51]MDR6814646.1 putative naringenin-chalcone synthase [Arcicella sp. BE140]MDR6826092.1 putative naringenin-chalcone synthase [Arcicella sp. BE139]